MSVLRGAVPELSTRFLAEQPVVPPSPAPEVTYLEVMLGTAEEDFGPGFVIRSGFDAKARPDVALLRFELARGGHRWSAITTAEGEPHDWPPGFARSFPFHRGDLVLGSVTAIDLAGHESAPALLGAYVVSFPRLPRCGGVPDTDPGTPVLPVILLFIAGIAVAISRHSRRVRARRSAVPESISLLVVELLARAAQRRGGLCATLGIVGVPVLVNLELGGLAAVSTIVGCIGLRGFFVARAVLQLIEADPRRHDAEARPATAEALGSVVIVRRGDDEAELEVSPPALLRARAHAVPASIARRS